MRTKLGITLLLLAFGFAGGLDKADAKAPPGGYGAAMITAAEEYWGHAAPRCSSLTIEFETAPPAWPDRMGAATVGVGGPCHIWLQGLGYDLYTQCTVAVHEWGHILGYGWGLDPHSITYDGDAAEDLWEPGRIGACVRMVRSTR